MTKLRAFLASVVLALLTVLAVAQPAAADDNAPITRYDATVNLTDDGVAEITVDFTMDFSQVRGRGPIIILPLRQEDGADPDWDWHSAAADTPETLRTLYDDAIAASDLARDEVFIETQPDKLETWRRCSFDVFFKGDDWRGTPKGDELERRFAAVGVQVVYFPYTVHTSSTKLRRALTLLESPSEDLETLVLES